MTNERYQRFLDALKYVCKNESINYEDTKRTNVKRVRMYRYELMLIYAGSGLKYYVKGITKEKFLQAWTASDYAFALKQAFAELHSLVDKDIEKSSRNEEYRQMTIFDYINDDDNSSSDK